MEQNTNLLDEAYKKIMADKELQIKFIEAAKADKLEDFLKELNINATVEEVKDYLTKKFTNENGELSKEELDMAAGGDKRTFYSAAWSIVSLGIGCGISAAINKSSRVVCT